MQSEWIVSIAKICMLSQLIIMLAFDHLIIWCLIAHYHSYMRSSSLNHPEISLQAENHSEEWFQPQSETHMDENWNAQSIEEPQSQAVTETPEITLLEKPESSVGEKPESSVGEKPESVVEKPISTTAVETKLKSPQPDEPATKNKMTQTDISMNEFTFQLRPTAEKALPSTSSANNANEPKKQAPEIGTWKPVTERVVYSPRPFTRKLKLKSSIVQNKIEKEIVAAPVPKAPSPPRKSNETDVKKDAMRASPERKLRTTFKASAREKPLESTSNNGNAIPAANGEAAAKKSNDVKLNGNSSTKSTTPVTSSKSPVSAKAAPKVSIPSKRVDSSKPQSPSVTSATPPQTPTKEPIVPVQSVERLKVEHTIPVTPPASSKTSKKPVLPAQTPTITSATPPQTPTKESIVPVQLSGSLKVEHTIPATPPASSKTTTKPLLAGQTATLVASEVKQTTTKNSSKKRSKKWIVNDLNIKILSSNAIHRHLRAFHVALIEP